ncbi:hypothetical protein C1H46_038812 [Malus baccata]|uniref:Uncharacterized protein n=1 Tax=Malus baccata TaxID=106549 RepID=A0A540KNA2_MALBA|nr:hypothetical protein C1H46_038812 [Malus baccata]
MGILSNNMVCSGSSMNPIIICEGVFLTWRNPKTMRARDKTFSDRLQFINLVSSLTKVSCFSLQEFFRPTFNNS